MVFRKGDFMNVTKRRVGSLLLAITFFPVAYWCISSLDGDPEELKQIALSTALYGLFMGVIIFSRPLNKKELNDLGTKP